MALCVLWDASALTKRYALELGSETTDALWANVPSAHMATTFTVYAELLASLLRKQNRGDIDALTRATALTNLRQEIINSLDFRLLAVETVDVLVGIDMTERHNLNSADASILATFLRYALASDEICLLVASDKRLLRAASAEGLATLNPETLAAADVPAFLSAL